MGWGDVLSTHVARRLSQIVSQLDRHAAPNLLVRLDIISAFERQSACAGRCSRLRIPKSLRRGGKRQAEYRAPLPIIKENPSLVEASDGTMSPT
jgi:hypothetical protein